MCLPLPSSCRLGSGFSRHTDTETEADDASGRGHLGQTGEMMLRLLFAPSLTLTLLFSHFELIGSAVGIKAEDFPRWTEVQT